MARHPKQTEERLIAEARLLAATVRRHFAGFQAADAGRKRKFLPESRLLAFEAAIARLRGAIGGRALASTKQLGATDAEAERRSRLYEVIRALREEVKLGLPEDPATGKAFGVGMRMSHNSTPRVLAVAQVMLSSWGREEFREPVMRIGVTEARMEEVRELTVGLAKDQAKQDLMCGAARGQTLAKDAQLAKVQQEMVYVRRVARFVFGKEPAVLVEFMGKVRRGAKRRRGARAAGEEGKRRGRAGGSSRKGVPSSREERGSLRQDGSSLRQDGPSLRQDGSSLRQDGPSLRQDGSSLRQDGSSLRQSGSSLRQDGSSLRQDGPSANKEGSFPRRRAASGRDAGAAPHVRRRRRR
jgi:hypothetical protein